MLAGTVATALVVGAAWATTRSSGHADRPADALEHEREGRYGTQQVLGGQRDPGVPTVQRLRHDDVDFTVTVAPARPGPNLVRIDATIAGDAHAEHRYRSFQVGTVESTALVTARPRPGVDGLWVVVDLPEGSGTVLVSHGPDHRVPFAVETGFDDLSRDEQALWKGSDGPECLTVAATAVLAGGRAPGTCPASALAEADRTALVDVVELLVSRGVEEITVEGDDSDRSVAAADVVRRQAEAAGVRIAPADAPASSTQGVRNALLVLGGWADAADRLADVSRKPLHRQPIRSDGTWLAPWLLTPGVVDSTSGAVLALDFDIRDPAAQEYGQTLATYFPGQAPTASGYVAWRAARGEDPSPLTLYAASRAAYMPNLPGHVGHESEVSWFPGGTVTPVGPLSTSATSTTGSLPAAP